MMNKKRLYTGIVIALVLEVLLGVYIYLMPQKTVSDAVDDIATVSTSTLEASASSTPETNLETNPETSANIPPEVAPVVQPQVVEYIKIEGGCDWKRSGECVHMRSGPGTQYPVVLSLRDGIVLRVGKSVVVDGQTWYKITFSIPPRYPDRLKGDLYVAQTEAVHLFEGPADEVTSTVNASSTKRIVVDISEQKLYAYDGDTLFMEQVISTGIGLNPTPKGTFFIYRKTPSRYMQGPIAGISDQYYDLPGVPWDLYFTKDGAVVHGAYWHDSFGKPWSHGCVNLPPDQAEKLYSWAEIGTPITIRP